MNALPALALFSLAAFGCAQQQPGESAAQQPGAQQPDPAKVLQEVLQQFEKEGIVFDGKTQTVTIKAKVNQPQDPIEYLLIYRRGKRHEAMFITQSKPSVLNAALLMLGLEPGSNAAYVEKKPRPTLEEIERGVDPLIVTPPKGTPLWFTVKWKTPEGKPVEYCVEDLLLELRTQRPVRGCSWVYLGGRMARLYKNEPEVYVADYEGNLFSTCYLVPDNHLVTMVHEFARDDQNWWMTSKMPEPDTDVEIVIHKNEPQLHKDREVRVAKEAKAERVLQRMLILVY